MRKNINTINREQKKSILCIVYIKFHLAQIIFEGHTLSAVVHLSNTNTKLLLPSFAISYSNYFQIEETSFLSNDKKLINEEYVENFENRKVHLLFYKIKNF